MHPRTIMAVFASIWAAFYGAPYCLDLCAVLTGADAPQARRICPVGRARRKDTSYRHRGPGWKILGPYSDARGPGGGRAARTAARDPRKRPAAGPGPPSPLGANFGRPKNCNQAWPPIAHSATPGGFQHKVSCPRTNLHQTWLPQRKNERAAAWRPRQRDSPCGRA